MIPTFSVNCMFCSFFILVIAKHHIRTFGEYLSRNVMWVNAVYFHFLTVCSLSARTLCKCMPIAVTYNRGALCGSITDRIREVNTSQECFHFLIQCSSTNNNFISVTSKCLINLFADALFYFLLITGIFISRRMRLFWTFGNTFFLMIFR